MNKTATNKTEIIDLISAETEISKSNVQRVLNSFFEAITVTLQSGKAVTFPGFGTYSVKSRAARVGRNPKTGEPINIEASNVPSFKAGKGLKDAVNSGSVVSEAEEA